MSTSGAGPGGAASPAGEADFLRRQSAFARRLARTLLGDHDLAEDVVQDAMVAALEDGEAASRPRSWWSAVTRNLARSVIRSRGRRRRRERAVGGPSPVEAAVDAAARIEMQRRVLEAVESLDEIYRTALVLRFLDGLKPREIAARLGIPVDTVHTRIQRGLQRLRVQLDASHGGRRSAWFAPLALLAESGSPKMPWVPAVAASVVVAGASLVGWNFGDGSAAPVSAPVPATLQVMAHDGACPVGDARVRIIGVVEPGALPRGIPGFGAAFRRRALDRGDRAAAVLKPQDVEAPAGDFDPGLRFPLTDVEGLTRWPRASSLVVDAIVEHPGFAPLRVRLDLSRPRTVVRLKPGGDLLLRAAPGAWVRVVRPGLEAYPVLRTRVPESGTVHVAALPEGRYRVYAPGTARGGRDFVVRPRMTRLADVRK